jgi:hypothetical protein
MFNSPGDLEIAANQQVIRILKKAWAAQAELKIGVSTWFENSMFAVTF